MLVSRTVLTAVSAALAVSMACGGDGGTDSTITLTTVGPCGTEPLPPCPSFGLPVELEVHSSRGIDFPPLPDARAAAFPGDTVNFRVSGLTPDEEVRVFSTEDTYRGTRYTAGDDGTLALPVQIPSQAEPGIDLYAVAQAPADGGQPLLASFMIVTVDPDSAGELQDDLLREAMGLAGSGDATE